MGQRGATGSVSVDAEGVSAFHTLEAVENVLVDEITERGAGRPAGNTTDQTAQQGASQSAQGRAGRAGEGADRGADPGAGGGSRNTAGRAGNRADRGTDLAACVIGCDPDGPAARALKNHGGS